MEDLIKAIVLGVVQGATEFIPVSSSGHLVIVPWLLGWPPSTLLFDAILHWGTLLSILLVFGRDFWAMLRAASGSLVSRSLDYDAKLAWLIVLGSIPAATVGFLFEDQFEALFVSTSAPLVAGVSLLITAGLLAGSEVLTRHLAHAHDLRTLSATDSVLIGGAQVLALVPGVSRSGSTIAAGLTRGLRRDAAARFSFLLGAPVFFGAGLLQLVGALAESTASVVDSAPLLLVGFICSAVTGFIAIRFLLAYLRTKSLYPFALYCLLVGLGVSSLALWQG